MGFQRVLPMYVTGCTLFDESLDGLHSDEIDADELRRWAVLFATRVFPESEEPVGGSEYSFRELFMLDLRDYCVHVALPDGSLSGREIVGINKLIDVDFAVERESASEISEDVDGEEWREDFPVSFKYMVSFMGKYRKAPIDAVQEIAFFFYQVARFIHSIDNKNPYDETAPTYKFAKAFLLYVERVSEIDFEVPEGESVEEVCKERNRLVRREMDRCSELVEGSWRTNRGTGLEEGGILGFVLEKDGVAYVLKRRLFGSKRIEAVWKVIDRANFPTPLIYVPSLRASIDCTLITPDGERILAMVGSSDRRLNGLMGICERC